MIKTELPEDKQKLINELNYLIGTRIKDIGHQFLWDNMTEEQRCKGIDQIKRHIEEDIYIKMWRKDILFIYQVYGKNVMTINN